MNVCYGVDAVYSTLSVRSVCYVVMASVAPLMPLLLPILRAIHHFFIQNTESYGRPLGQLFITMMPYGTENMRNTIQKLKYQKDV